MQGLIIKSISGEYTVLIGEEQIVCKPLGIFRHKNMSPKVGDIVDVENFMITEIHERKNDLIRPSIANVDKVFIITSLVEPDLNTNLLDRLISLVEWENIDTVLIFTKADLTNIENYKLVLDYYHKLGYPVYIMPGSAKEIINEISENISVVAGQSGVGKSTMLNTFEDFGIKTDKISRALGRGKHTTRHTELLPVGNGWIADTPGFGILDLDMDVASLSHTFREFFNLECRFSNCLHLEEPGCSVRKAVQNKEVLESRYANYKQFVLEIKNRKKY
jgi:ribosome biogenesis GTPase